MKLFFLSALLVTISASAWPTNEITPNHQINPPHSFNRLVCLESKTQGTSGYTIIIEVPNTRDAEAKVYFNRLGAQRSLIAVWQVKYILAPGVYATFANRFQKMDISRGDDDQFELSLQLHSGNGINGIYESIFTSPLLVGYSSRSHYTLLLNQKNMNCKFQ